MNKMSDSGQGTSSGGYEAEALDRLRRARANMMRVSSPECNDRAAFDEARMELSRAFDAYHSRFFRESDQELIDRTHDNYVDQCQRAYRRLMKQSYGTDSYTEESIAIHHLGIDRETLCRYSSVPF